jgi:protein phosphatase
MSVRLAWGSDPGLLREDNEDSVVVLNDRAGLDALLVVADGMGGHAAGQVASSIAAETMAAELENDGSSGASADRLREAFLRTNAAVFDASRDAPERAGMGSTVVVAAISGMHMALLNVGDSPAYLLRGDDVSVLTQDHSWPAEQARLGVITEEQARDHPMKHRLTRAVGVWDQVQAYTAEKELRKGDLVVLCTDGLEAAGLTREEVCMLLQVEDLEKGVERVLDACVARGAPDNVTVAVAYMEGARAKREFELTRTRRLPRLARRGE